MRKKILVTFLSIALLWAMVFPGCIISEASELSEIVGIPENQSEYSDFSLEQVDIAEVPVKSYNNIDRPYAGGNIVVDGISAYSGSNTNPNNALIFEDNVGESQTFTMANEERWYVFRLSEKNKASVYLGMDAAMDADIYVFSLDNSTATLNLIGGSANSTLGQAEYYSAVLEAGAYYVCVTNYAGVGSYNIAYYQTNVDVNYELNDSLDTATDIIFNQKMVGVLDSPYDIDLYKLTVTEYTWIRMFGNYPGKFELGILGSTEGAEWEREGNTGNVYVFSPGTYWFIVRSLDGGYSSTVTYDCTFERVGGAEKIENYMYTGHFPGTSFEIRQSNDKKLTYINGNMVDIRYLWTHEASNNYGSKAAIISVTPDENTVCSYMGVVDYSRSTHPIMKNRNGTTLLEMTFKSDSEFYKIHWVGTGMFDRETVKLDSPKITVLIEPESGKIVDIVSPNYYYTLKNDGTNGISMIRRRDEIVWDKR
jgi:hypothetical protein